MHGSSYDAIVSPGKLKSMVEFLCDSLCAGRGSGTRGGNEAAFWLARQYSHLNLTPFGRFSHSFPLNDKAGHNIVGFVPGRAGSKYIIVIAHYDHLGILEGKMYPGADSNASGVAGLLSLAEMFSVRATSSDNCDANMIFVATDGRMANMAGAKAFCEELIAGKLTDPRSGHQIEKGDIAMLVNLDIIGSTFSPIKEGRDDYLLMLGSEQFQRDLLLFTNRSQDIGLDLCFDYYGSADFTELFYRRISEQRPFMEVGIPSTLFTSGITLRTNRMEDDAESLDYEILRKRILLIYHWICAQRV